VLLVVLAPGAAAATGVPAGTVLAYQSVAVPDEHLVAVFDDGAQADQALLRYVARVDRQNDTAARVHVELGLLVGSADPTGPHVRYFGRAHVAQAQAGDYSFVRRLDASRLDLAHATISPDDSLPGTRPTVELPGRQILAREMDVVVFLENGTVCWEDAQGGCGVWSLWLPARGGNATPLVGYLDSPLGSDFGPAASGTARMRWGRWGVAPAMPGWEGHPLNVTLENLYDAPTGLLVGIQTREFVDDTLHHALGVTFYRAVSLARVEPPRDAPGPASVLALGVCGVTALARRRRA
jgi:hypothetical protein